MDGGDIHPCGCAGDLVHVRPSELRVFRAGDVAETCVGFRLEAFDADLLQSEVGNELAIVLLGFVGASKRSLDRLVLHGIALVRGVPVLVLLRNETAEDPRRPVGLPVGHGEQIAGIAKTKRAHSSGVLGSPQSISVFPQWFRSSQ